MKTVCISFANGCPRSMIEAARLVDYFRLNGWQVTPKFSRADLVIVGVCGVSDDMERASMKYLAIADRRRKGGAPFVVFGCLAGINEPLVKAHFDAATVTRKNLDLLDSLAQAPVKLSQVKYPNDVKSYTDYIHRSYSFWDELRAKNKFKFSSLAALKLLSKLLKCWYQRPDSEIIPRGEPFYIRIAGGCSGLCSYCAIKNAAGPLQSRPLAEVREDFRKGLAQGCRAIRLLAEDVGSYGQDLGLTIVDLLRELLSHPGDYQLIIDDFSPKWLVRYYQELQNLFHTYGRKFAHLGLEIQSGSERILDLMHREYQAAQAKACILGLKQACPDLKLYTHVLLGFPGETEADFLDTLDFLKTVQFHWVSIYKYSDRPNTLSATLPDKVPEKIKMDRVCRIISALGGTACLAG